MKFLSIIRSENRLSRATTASNNCQIEVIGNHGVAPSAPLRCIATFYMTNGAVEPTTFVELQSSSLHIQQFDTSLRHDSILITSVGTSILTHEFICENFHKKVIDFKLLNTDGELLSDGIAVNGNEGSFTGDWILVLQCEEIKEIEK